MSDKTMILAIFKDEESAGGKAAVGVLAAVPEATFVASRLAGLGGVAETHSVSDEAVEEAQTAATADVS